MTERYSFAVDGNVVWAQENMENSTLTDTITEGYVTAEEESPTRYLSVLDSSNEMSLENLNMTLPNPKLEVEDAATDFIVRDQPEEANDQVVIFSVEGSDELFGIQMVQDEEGNLQKYQFQFRRNDDGQLEAIPETITLIPMEDEPQEEVEQQPEFAEEETVQEALHVFVQEDNSHEHILPDHFEDNGQNQETEEGVFEEQVEQQEQEVGENEMYDEVEEVNVDIKPGILQLQNVKQEIQEHQAEYSSSPIENQEVQEFEEMAEPVQDQSETNYEYVQAEEEDDDEEEEEEVQELGEAATNPPPTDIEEYQEKGPGEEENLETVEATMEQEFEHVEVSPDMEVQNEESQDLVQETEEVTMNDSDENDYQIVEGLHITGDVEDNEDDLEIQGRHIGINSNILKHALRSNKEVPKIVKKDNKLYLYVVQHPEKENVDSLSLEMSNLCKPKVNPRSILKSSHAMFQTKNEIDAIQDERMNKRFARCKEAMQAMLFHNFISKTTIPQAPVRKNRLPRKQKIKPVERMDEEIVVQEMMVSSNGFVETVGGGVNKENLAVTEYVELTDSDDDYDPKRITRKKKRYHRKKVSITISDDSDTSHDSVIELDESDDESPTNKKSTNNNTPPKRRRGRPPKNKSTDQRPNATESPAKKSRYEPTENPTKPEIPCPKCDKTFPSQNSLKTHLQHHNLQSSIKKAMPEYKYKCDRCATTFINSILLKKHMCSKLFSCSICKKQFPDLSSANGHKRTHAKQQMVKSTEVAKVSPKAKPVQPTNTFKIPKSTTIKCKTCGKQCSSMLNLNTHMKTHTFNCSTCSKSFVSQLLLEKHLRESCVKSPRSRLKSAKSPEKKSPKSSRLTLGARVKCDKCTMTFNSHQALFKHKVVKHGLETPDKRVIGEDDAKGKENTGVPAARRLQGAVAGLSVQLDFSE